MMEAVGMAKGKVKIQPLADRVAIRPLEDTEKMKGGLYIPDTAKEKPVQGEIIAIGQTLQGDKVPMELKVGDRVLYRKYSGTEVKLGDEDILIIKESDVLAVIG
jgi:chaperonin GroES